MALKVLHCPTNIGSFASTLASYERQVGLDSTSYVYQNTQHYIDVTNSIFSKDSGALGNEIQAWKFLLKEALKYDIIHYNFGSTIIPVKRFGDPLNPRYPKLLHKAYELYRSGFEEWELRWLKKHGKKIFVTFQGDDARIGAFHRDNYEISPVSYREYLERALSLDSYNARIAEMFAKYTEKMYALNPDLLQTLPSKAEFLPYASVDIKEWKYVGSHPSEVLKIVHAPTYRGVKGTPYVLDAISRLQQEGYKCELILIENMSRSEARQQYEQADIAIDQLLIGWYGGLGVELMALGKPLVVYIREEDLKFIPREMRESLPMINATPDTIYNVIKELITHKKSMLSEIGRQSRKFVETWHDPAKIALQMKTNYEAALKPNN